MAAFTSSGAFSTLNYNQSLLNSKKNKSFLYKGATRRFKNSNVELALVPVSDAKKESFMAGLRQSITQDRKIDVLILAVSVLLTKLLLMAIV